MKCTKQRWLKNTVDSFEILAGTNVKNRMQAKVIVGDGDPERPRPKNYRAFKEEDSGGAQDKAQRHPSLATDRTNPD